MHKYIDYNKLHDFSSKKSLDSILDDIIDKYKITNIIDNDEGIYYIADALYFDYTRGLSNYESYIECNMDARLMMELRKSAILYIAPELSYFFTGHNKCNTIKDVKAHRINFLKNFCSDYKDLNWQYYFLIRHNLRSKSIGFIFDFEECYDDGDWRKQTNPDNYEREFIEAHVKSFAIK